MGQARVLIGVGFGVGLVLGGGHGNGGMGWNFGLPESSFIASFSWSATMEVLNFFRRSRFLVPIFSSCVIQAFFLPIGMVPSAKIIKNLKLSSDSSAGAPDSVVFGGQRKFGFLVTRFRSTICSGFS